MQFTKTTIALLLPLLAIASPTPSNTANENTLESRGSTVDVNALKDLQQRIYDARGQITAISENIVSTSNAVLSGESGSAADAYKQALARYQAAQSEALGLLGLLAQSVGDAGSSYEETEMQNSGIWS